MMDMLAALLLLLQPSAPPVIAPAPVLPDDRKPSYRAQSPPLCVDWRAARDGTAEHSELRAGIYRLWVLGYVTGFNFVGPDPAGDLLGDAPREELYAAIDGYCARNPSHSVEDSMRPIAAAYVRRRQGTSAASIQPQGTGRRAMAEAAKTCRDWGEDRDDAILRLAYVSLVRGYVTAYNRWGPDPVGDALGADDTAIIEGGLDDWCRERPSALLVESVPALIAHVAAERAAGRLPPGGMGHSDRFGTERPAVR